MCVAQGIDSTKQYYECTIETERCAYKILISLKWNSTLNESLFFICLITIKIGY